MGGTGKGMSIHTGVVGRERGTGCRGAAELDVAVREATELAVAIAVLPERAQLRLVRRAAARRGQHLSPVWGSRSGRLEGFDGRRSTRVGGPKTGGGKGWAGVGSGTASRWHISVCFSNEKKCVGNLENTEIARENKSFKRKKNTPLIRNKCHLQRVVHSYSTVASKSSERVKERR